MLSLAHTATGAFIATVIPNPFISTPLILISHYIEDKIPHWDVGTGISSGRKKKSDALKHEVIDLILSAIFLYFVFQFKSPTLNFNAAYGAFIALIPDFIEAPENFLHLDLPILRPFNKFHHTFHHSIPNKLKGLAPQFLLLIVIALLSR
jgi:hypothetical protein